MNPIPTLSTIAVKHIQNFPGRDTIVFLHDSLGCIETWHHFPETLATQLECNLFVYDRHGYGRSGPFTQPRETDYMEKEADVLAALIDQYALGRVILFGHSDGGTIALITAAIYPELIKAVITEGAHIFVEDVTLHGIWETGKKFLNTGLRSKLEKYHGRNTEELFRAWVDTWCSSEFRNWSIEHLLPSVTCPVLVIQGENDEFGTLAQVDGISKNVTGPVKKLVIRHTTHTPHKSHSLEVYAGVASFVRKL